MFSWSPPPTPKIPPTSVAIRIRSVIANGCGPAGWPIAAYSPGSIVKRAQRALGLLDVGVDPGDVVLGVVVDCRSEALEPVDLALEVVVVVRLARPHALIHADVRPARELRERRVSRVAQDVDEEQPVLGGRVSDPEHQLGARVAVDVGHAEARVTFDRHARLRALGAPDVPGWARRTSRPCRTDRSAMPGCSARRSSGSSTSAAGRCCAAGTSCSSRNWPSCRSVVEAVLPRGQDVVEVAVVVGSRTAAPGRRRAPVPRARAARR